MYKELTLDMLETFLKELSEQNHQIPCVEHVGNGLYKIGEGVYTGKSGVLEFHKAMIEQVKKSVPRYDPKTPQKINEILDKIEKNNTKIIWNKKKQLK